MGFKKNDTCLANTQEDEPIFVLVARDLLAPQVIRYWANLVEERITKFSPERAAKVKGARDVARLMEEWQASHGGKIPD